MKRTVFSGWVEAIDEDFYYCRVREGELFDGSTRPGLVMTCPIDKLNPHELSFLCVGAYVSINVHETEPKQVHLDTVFYKALQTATDMEKAQTKAKEILTFFQSAEEPMQTADSNGRTTL